MPRVKTDSNRLYTAQITNLQTLLKLSNVDERIPPKVRQHISACVSFIVTALSNAQSPKMDGQIT